MSSGNIVLRFQYPPSGSNSDIRTFRVYHVIGDSSDVAELYRFYHPLTGLSSGVTTFQRRNLTTNVWDSAGQIDWTSNSNATVTFGIDDVNIRDLRRAKKSSSKSRRFKAGGSEYKWKIAENNIDLFCVDSRGRTVATWAQSELTLCVVPSAEAILDHLVVTCLLHLWIRQLGRW
ncbi:hypothetical protein GLOTRDRAFT_103596 [Gloeophyllum trabeum ATCC 11539]|uniref:DUF6593 domain-containing protein n=1 Tax=Gloeophyllum trabeum (strain ATCC 11539 / FP-39264 / Madison 617) TaxID=670483 RepID=S7S1G8_GLOTA|nr:uncharacterized protein GLOTRDRAFT_103596 [Gloeophyllum trabeum ATCC 11539]EPQ59599.1 hypothetical protein GLOTRDRAFT_103596 [Gloeophyllum trabeum ATCC 11539]